MLHYDTAARQPGSRFIRDDNLSTVLIFVHGLSGDATTTWTHNTTHAYFPDLVAADTLFRDVSVYVYEYPSSFSGGTFRINELAENMRLVLERDGVLQRRELIFVAHSMGGLVTRALLLKYRDLGQRVRLLYFFGTPTTGADIARIASLITANPQVEQLRATSPSLEDLQRDWLAANFQIPAYCGYERRPTLPIGLVVAPQSAMTLCNRPADPIDADHMSIAKPEDRAMCRMLLLAKRFPRRRHERPRHRRRNSRSSRESPKMLERSRRPSSSRPLAARRSIRSSSSFYRAGPAEFRSLRL